MILVHALRCQHEGCNELAHYNLPGERPKYCRNHKLSTMVNRERKICRYTNCTVTATFGIKGHAPTACVKHKTNEMINITRVLCKSDGCEKTASFGTKGDKALYCAKHKGKTMLNLKQKRCEILLDGNGNTCDKPLNYGFKGQKKVACLTHRKSGMINLCARYCTVEGCTLQVQCGPLFGKKVHCLRHKAPNEFKDNKPKCTTEKGKSVCRNLAYYMGKDNNRRCEEHKLKDDINVVEKPCKSCDLPYHLPENRDMCDACEGFPTVRLKAQERVKELLDKNNIIYESYDRPVDPMCSKKKPDFVIDKPLFKVVLEVDERQHLDYTCECELLRMMQIHQDFGGPSVLFLRYNPDKYIDDKGKACTATQFREKELVRILGDLNNYTEWNEHLSVIYLFYNGYNGVPSIIDLSTTLPLSD